MSLPAPPIMLSAPAPPSRMSLPVPPSSVSLPAKLDNLSLPAKPLNRSLLATLVSLFSVSLPVVPIIKFSSAASMLKVSVAVEVDSATPSLTLKLKFTLPLGGAVKTKPSAAISVAVIS
ncbi:hypothetical protein CXB77_14415 [Chromatium okenii]|uniref:Uncharacterized protein n=1 Tax=Chromatium okenii TaxID=61644 RepID=A0A2S7XNT6_9GAMM|nr:hypothetical protein CXB77_14415 [Chromatium okenii]